MHRAFTVSYKPANLATSHCDTLVYRWSGFYDLLFARTLRPVDLEVQLNLRLTRHGRRNKLPYVASLPPVP